MTQIDTEQRISTLIANAEAGDREAQFQLGLAYDEGDGVPFDDKLATLWFKRSAQQEHPEALARYGDALYYGRGVQQDFPKSFTQYLRGANLGNLACQFAIGFAYFSGEGVEVDEKLGEMWLRRAADLGSADAQVHLGFKYESGTETIPKDLTAAAQWFRKSAAQGNVKAMKAMGSLHLLKDEDEFDYDPLEALYWFKKGADAGDGTCMCEYGKLLGWEDHIPQNLPEAIIWARKGAVVLQDSWSAEIVALLLNWMDPGFSPEIFYWTAKYFVPMDIDGNSAALMGSAYRWQADQTGSIDAYSLAIWWWELDAARGGQFAAEHLEHCKEKGGTRKRAQEILAERDLTEDDILHGDWIIPLDPSEPTIHRDNLPVPPVVREEMGENFEAPEEPARRTEPLPQAAAPASAATPEQDATKPAEQYSSDPFAGLPNMRITQLPPGSILADKFLIEKVLGKGGMAIVFKAKHLLMERSVAIKMMLPEVARDATTAQRFQREAKSASMLRHPNVITIYDYGVTPEGQPFMVMDYLEGKSLEDVLELEGPVTLSRGLSILMQVCDALGHAHQEGILHRDIKPSNIMIEQRRAKEHVLLVDFGIAKTIGDQSEQQQKLTKTGEVFGSLVYMSPEQCTGKPLDARSDIYAFGCVFYEVFTGETAFMGETVFETMTKHIYDPAPVMNAVKATEAQRAELNAVFQKCVAKAPEDRYQSMEEVKEALLALK